MNNFVSSKLHFALPMLFVFPVVFYSQYLMKHVCRRSYYHQIRLFLVLFFIFFLLHQSSEMTQFYYTKEKWILIKPIKKMISFAFLVMWLCCFIILTRNHWKFVHLTLQMMNHLALLINKRKRYEIFTKTTFVLLDFVKLELDFQWFSSSSKQFFLTNV